MTLNDVIALAKAGFTREDIIAITRVNSVAPAPAPAAPAAPVPAPAAPAPAPAAPAPAPAAPAPAPADWMMQMEQMLQRHSIQQAEQPKPPSDDDILAAIINPPLKGDGN